MNKEKKNKIKYFYQILSDIKNNIDTLVKELYENKDNLDKFAISKPVILKSKYPDLKKLNIITKTRNIWEITDIGKELLDIFETKNEDEYNKMVASIIGTYSYNGFRPYAVFCKFLFIKFGIKEYFDRDEISKFLSLPINDVMYFINNKKETSLKNIYDDKKTEAMRPYAYIINYLQNAGLIIKDGKNIKFNSNIEEFLDIFFSEIDLVPKDKKELSLHNYRVVGRGIDQVTFRNELLVVYNEKCAISGKYFKFGKNNLLEAAHIIPVSHGGSYDVNNGILMTPDLHKAFDAGAFTFDDEYNLIIHQDVYEQNYLPLDKKINYLPKDKINHPSLISINYHKKYIYGLGVTKSKK